MTKKSNKLRCGDIVKKTKRAWTLEENSLLKFAVDSLGLGRWKQIAKLVPQRDPTQCSQHWKKVLDPKLVKGFWTAEEDATLVRVKGDNEDPSWSKISDHIPGRSAKQCRERWNNSLNPGLKKSRFSPEEDKILMVGWEKYGTRWNLIVKTLPGRTQTKIRDRFKTLRLRHKEHVEKYERIYGNRGSEGVKEALIISKENKPQPESLVAKQASAHHLDSTSAHHASMTALEANLFASYVNSQHSTFDGSEAFPEDEDVSLDELTSMLSDSSGSDCPSSPEYEASTPGHFLENVVW